MREARGVVTDTHEVHAARTYDGRDVLELTFWRDNSGTTVVIPLEAAEALTADLITASREGWLDRAKRETAGP